MILLIGRSNILKNEKIRIDNEIQYIKPRLKEAKDQLTLSEDKLMDFQKNYSMFDNYPTLVLKRARLVRNIQIDEQIYSTIRQQFEEEKCKQLSNTSPLIILNVPALVVE